MTTPKSYKEYLEEKLSDPILAYDEAQRSVMAQADKINPERASTGEALSALGLSDSGYAAYLKREAAAAEKTALAGQAKAYRTASAQAENAYRAYLEAFHEKNAVDIEGVVSAIKKKGIVEEATALDIAKGYGLSDEDAKLAAKTATEELVNTLKKKVLAVVQRDGMGREHAMAYALGQGLPADLAAEIGDYADAWNRIYSKSDSIREYYNQ